MNAGPWFARAWRTIGPAVGVTALLGGCKSSSGPTPVVVYLQVTPAVAWLQPRAIQALTVTALDKDAKPLTGLTPSFTSGDTSLAHVSAAGVIQVGALRVGRTRILVTLGSLTDTVPLLITGTPRATLGTPFDTTIFEGQSFQLVAHVVDSLDDTIPPAPIGFQSNNPAVLSVSGTGLVQGLQPGATTVAISSSGVSSSSVSVTVRDTNLLQRLSLANAPFGVATTTGGLVYVAPILGPSLHRVNVGGLAFADSVLVLGNPVEIGFQGTLDTALVTDRSSSRLDVVDVTGHAVIGYIPIPADPYAIRVSAGGLAYVGTGSGGWVYKVNLAARARVDSVAVSGSVFQMALGPGDSLLYISDLGTDSVVEVRTATMAVTRRFGLGTSVKPQALAVSPDGSELYVANEFGGLDVVTLATGILSDSVVTGGGTFGVALSPDGSTLYATTTTGVAYVIDRVTHTVRHQVLVGGTLRLVVVDPVTGRAVIANEGADEVDIVR